MLVDHGADLEKTNVQERSALHEAAKARHLATVKYLVEAGASIAAQDVRGLMALDLAFTHSHITVQKYLDAFKR